MARYSRTNIGAQVYTYNGLGDRVRVDKPTGARHFVYDSQGRVLAEFNWALPPGAARADGRQSRDDH